MGSGFISQWTRATCFPQVEAINTTCNQTDGIGLHVVIATGIPQAHSDKLKKTSIKNRHKKQRLYWVRFSLFSLLYFPCPHGLQAHMSFDRQGSGTPILTTPCPRLHSSYSLRQGRLRQLSNLASSFQFQDSREHASRGNKKGATGDSYRATACFVRIHVHL